MWVAQPVRGTGAADILMDAVKAWANQAGYLRLSLWVYCANPRAVSFYRRSGLSFTGLETEDPGRGVRRLMVMAL